jgi:PAS domain S-box-containing protein
MFFSRNSTRLRQEFATALREGGDSIVSNRVVHFLADVVALVLLSLNTVLSVALLPWRPRRRKVTPPRRGSSDPIWALLDLEFRYRDMSPRFCELLGFSRSELVGKSVEYVTPPDFTNIQAMKDEVRRRRKKNGFWLYRRRDGHLVLVRYAIVLRSDNMADLKIDPISCSGASDPDRPAREA